MIEITYEGRCGMAYKLPLDYSLIHRPEQTATLGHYLMDMPPVHPFWAQYQLSIVHLRNIEGQTEPVKLHFPGATHEIQLMALNVPDFGRFTPEKFMAVISEPSGKGPWLWPPNIIEQVGGITDDQAKELIDAIARALVVGFLPAEPSDYAGGHKRWRDVLHNTAAHYASGGKSCLVALPPVNRRVH